MLDEWIKKMNEFVKKAANIIDKRWEDSTVTTDTDVSVGWNESVTALKDGVARVKIKPSSVDGWITIQENGSGGLEVLKIAKFSDTAGERTAWFPVHAGRKYYMYGESASYIKVTFLYFRK